MNDQAQGLRELVAQNPDVKQTPCEPDYRALWLGLKEMVKHESEAVFLNAGRLEMTQRAIRYEAFLKQMNDLEDHHD